MSAAVRALVRKEVRALAPTWGAGAAAVLALAAGAKLWFGDQDLTWVAFMLAAGALGAQAVGHEYLHRTVPLLLAQPVSRGVVLVVKLVVLAGFLTALAAVVFPLVAGDRFPFPLSPRGLLVTVWLTAFLLAPALTMWCRHVVGGAIFAFSLPATMLTIGTLIGFIRYGRDNDAAVSSFQQSFAWSAVTVLWIAGGIGAWWLFRTLDTSDSRPARQRQRWLHAPAVGRVSRPRHPLAHLIAKELRLQLPVLAVAGLYLLIATVHFTVMQGTTELLNNFVLGSFLAVWLLAIVAGALGSAEERSLGTDTMQLLLPMAGWAQWTVKAAAILGVIAIAAVTLPLGIVIFAADPAVRLEWPQVVAVVVVTTLLASGSLYASTLCASAVHALIAASALLSAGMWLVLSSTRVLERGDWAARWQQALGVEAVASGWVPATAASAFVLLLLVLGQRNHHHDGAGLDRALWQVPVLAMVLVGLTAVVVLLAPAAR